MRILRPHSFGDLCVSAILFVALLSAVVVSFPPSCAAQDATGTLEGHVSDKTGAVISGATVSLKNMETNAVRTQTTDGMAYTVLFNSVSDGMS